eukprot:gene32971-39876_t
MTKVDYHEAASKPMPPSRPAPPRDLYGRGLPASAMAPAGPQWKTGMSKRRDDYSSYYVDYRGAEAGFPSAHPAPPVPPHYEPPMA